MVCKVEGSLMSNNKLQWKELFYIGEIGNANQHLKSSVFIQYSSYQISKISEQISEKVHKNCVTYSKNEK